MKHRGHAATARRVAALALTVCAALAAPAAAQQPLAGEPTKATKVDRDGDGVFDDLERGLAPRPADQPVDVIVTLEEDASAARVQRLERRVGDLAVRDRFDVVDAFAARVTKEQVAELAARPGVAAVEADGRVRALNQSGSQAFGVTKARIDNPRLDGDADGNRARYSPRDMVAAVLDTGIYAKHRDLNEGKVLKFANCLSRPCRVRTPFDDNGHGTHVAGTLAGDGDALRGRQNRGVAPDAGLVGVKVLDRQGGGVESAVIRGIDWAVANRKRYGIEVINLSLGDGSCSDGTDAMSRAANRAAGAGLTVVAAAGNEGPDRCTIGAPAAAAYVLAVGSMADTAHGGFLASWKSARGQYGRRVKPDVMGPGVGVISPRAGTSTGYASKSGTSMASPFVAGVALLMRDANRSLSQAQLRQRIKARAVDWGPTGPDIDFGAGRLDAYSAIKSTGVAGLTTPPSTPAHRAFEGTLSAGEPPREYPLEVEDLCRPIAISMIVNAHVRGDPSRNNLDLFLKDPSGTIVNDVDEVVDGKPYYEGTYIERQEDLTHRPDRTGTWTLEVRGDNGSSGYSADVSAGLAPPPAGAPASCSGP